MIMLEGKDVLDLKWNLKGLGERLADEPREAKSNFY